MHAILCPNPGGPETLQWAEAPTPQPAADEVLIRVKTAGPTLRARPKEEKARLVHEAEEKVWPWIISGAFKPLIYKVYLIKKASEAHKMMESGAHIGKIVLEVAR